MPYRLLGSSLFHVPAVSERIYNCTGPRINRVNVRGLILSLLFTAAVGKISPFLSYFPCFCHQRRCSPLVLVWFNFIFAVFSFYMVFRGVTHVQLGRSALHNVFVFRHSMSGYCPKCRDWNLRSMSSSCPGHPKQGQLPEDQELWAWLRMLLVLGRTLPLLALAAAPFTHLVLGKRKRPQQPLQNYSWVLKERRWLLEQVKLQALRVSPLGRQLLFVPYVRYPEGNRHCCCFTVSPFDSHFLHLIVFYKD